MLKWLREWWNRDRTIDNSGFIGSEQKRVEEALKALQDPPDPASETLFITSEALPENVIAEPQNQVGAKVSYFTVQNDPEGTVYLDISSAGHDEQSVKDLAKIIASTFNIKVQAQTIGIVRENLISLQRNDLLEVFMKALIHAAAENGVSSVFGNVIGKEKPCVSPTDIIK